jgi:hypothetical protein
MLDPEIPPPPDPDASVEERQRIGQVVLMREGRRPARVPRRFGVGVLLLFVLLYALLFSFLSVLGAPAVVFACVAVYVTAVGLAQMLVFGGEKPREASIWVGVPVFMLMHTVGCVAAMERVSSLVELLGIVCVLVMGLVLAIPISYVTGGAMAGVFLLLDRVRTGVWNPDPDGLPEPVPSPPPSPPDEAPSNGRAG